MCCIEKKKQHSLLLLTAADSLAHGKYYREDCDAAWKSCKSVFAATEACILFNHPSLLLAAASSNLRYSGLKVDLFIDDSQQ